MPNSPSTTTTLFFTALFKAFYYKSRSRNRLREETRSHQPKRDSFQYLPTLKYEPHPPPPPDPVWLVYVTTDMGICLLFRVTFGQNWAAADTGYGSYYTPLLGTLPTPSPFLRNGLKRIAF